MCQYILENKTWTITLGLDVIADYINVLSRRGMENLLNKLGFHYQEFLFSFYNSKILNDDYKRIFWNLIIKEDQTIDLSPTIKSFDCCQIDIRIIPV